MRFAIIGLAALLAACNSTGAPRLGDEFTLRVGQSAAISELNLWMRFIEVTADSRCPANVTCVWEGDGAVLIEVAPLNGDSKESELHTSIVISPEIAMAKSTCSAWLTIIRRSIDARPSAR